MPGKKKKTCQFNLRNMNNYGKAAIVMFESLTVCWKYCLMLMPEQY